MSMCGLHSLIWDDTLRTCIKFSFPRTRLNENKTKKQATYYSHAILITRFWTAVRDEVMEALELNRDWKSTKNMPKFIRMPPKIRNHLPSLSNAHQYACTAWLTDVTFTIRINDNVFITLTHSRCLNRYKKNI